MRTRSLNEINFVNGCIKGENKKIKNYIKQKGDRTINIHYQYEAGFRWACRMGHIEIVNMLLELKEDKKIDIHIFKDEALRFACLYGRIEIVKRLISIKKEWTYIDLTDIFIESCVTGYNDIVKILIENENININIHKNNDIIFERVCEEGNIELVKLLLSLEGEKKLNIHEREENAFHKACENGHKEIVKLLLSLEGDRRIDVHASFDYAFRISCERGHKEIVKLLLELEGDRKIDINKDKQLAFRNACINGHKDVVDIIMSPIREEYINLRIYKEYNKELLYYIKLKEYEEIKKHLIKLDKKCNHIDIEIIRYTEEICIVNHEEVKKYKICKSNVPHIISLDMYERIGEDRCQYCKTDMDNNIYINNKNIRRSNRIKEKLSIG